MTTKSAMHYLKQMPPAYFKLAMEYVVSKSDTYQMNAPCESLPEALKRLNVWTPGKAREGYVFWANLYYHYSGTETKLPPIPSASIIVMNIESRSFIYQEAFNLGVFYKNILEALYVPMDGSRRTEQVFMRLILMTKLHQAQISGLSYATIGRIVAKLCDRKVRFDHSTVLHCLSKHNDLMDSKDRLYVGMYEAFETELSRIELANDIDFTPIPSEQFEPEFGC